MSTELYQHLASDFWQWWQLSQPLSLSIATNETSRYNMFQQAGQEHLSCHKAACFSRLLGAAGMLLSSELFLDVSIIANVVFNDMTKCTSIPEWTHSSLGSHVKIGLRTLMQFPCNIPRKFLCTWECTEQAPHIQSSMFPWLNQSHGSWTHQGCRGLIYLHDNLPQERSQSTSMLAVWYCVDVMHATACVHVYHAQPKNAMLTWGHFWACSMCQSERLLKIYRSFEGQGSCTFQTTLMP